MSKRFYYDEFSEDIFDDEIQQYPSNQTICNILNQQQERIAELEEQLKNVIVPKFKIGQEVWYVYNKIQLVPVKVIISDFSYYGYRKRKILYDSENYYEGMPECCLFATKEEAQAKLEKLKGEKK